MHNYISKGAELSTCNRYRYLLWREWRGTHHPDNWRWFTDKRGNIAKDGNGLDVGSPKSCVFVMLNPSTANGEKDDPTVHKCVQFCKTWKYERLEIVNLFAFRATEPKVVLQMDPADDPVGWANQEYVTRAVRDAGRIVLAWGQHGRHAEQDQTMLGWIGDAKKDDAQCYVLGWTADKLPRHPLFMKLTTKPELFDMTLRD